VTHTQKELEQTTGVLKYVSIPIAKNQLMMRVENIGDVYDKATAQTVNLKELLISMWENANAKTFDASAFTFDLTEMSLTGNMPLAELQERKIKWKTADDKLDQQPFLDYSTNTSAITLEAQRIRVFKVLCLPAGKETMFLQ
jgi:hypothetical protein